LRCLVAVFFGVAGSAASGTAFVAGSLAAEAAFVRFLVDVFFGCGVIGSAPFRLVEGWSARFSDVFAAPFRATLFARPLFVFSDVFVLSASVSAASTGVADSSFSVTGGGSSAFSIAVSGKASTASGIGSTD
jgi:hypothetical protein